MKTLHAITGKRTNGQTLVLDKMGTFSLRTTSAHLFDSKGEALEKLESIRETWKGLNLTVESIGDGSGLFDLISDNAQVGQDGY